jgi:hypothetical protein
MDYNQEIWHFLDRHLQTIYKGDRPTYKGTTAEDLSLYEYWIMARRQDGLDFHQFMIENRWAGDVGAQRYDLFEKRCQRYGDTAVVTYTFMFTQALPDGIRHRSHNESRVLVKQGDQWQVVHVHKSPASWPISEAK